MKVAVAYAEAKRQMVIETDVADGSSAEQAIRSSGILGKISDIDLSKNKIGIFGKVVPLEQVLADGDRVEIYRPAIGKPPKKSGANAKTAAKPVSKARTDDGGDDGKAKQPAAETSPDVDLSGGTDDNSVKDAAAEARAARMSATKARIAAAKAKAKLKVKETDGISNKTP